MQVDLSNL